MALLAIWAGGDRRLATEFLRQSGDMKMESGVASELTSDAVAPLARWYTDLRSAAAKSLLAAEAEAIRAMVGCLPRSLTIKRARRAHPSKGQKGT